MVVKRRRQPDSLYVVGKPCDTLTTVAAAVVAKFAARFPSDWTVGRYQVRDTEAHLRVRTDYDAFTANKCVRAFGNGPMTVMSRGVDVLPAENNQNNTDVIFINNARAPCKQKYTTPAIAVHLLRFRTLLSRGSQ